MNNTSNDEQAGVEPEDFQERYKRWIWASQGLAHFPLVAVSRAQSIGRQDIELIREDQRRSRLDLAGLGTIEESAKLTDQIASSEQWVLTAYELVRVVFEYYKKRPEIADLALGDLVVEVRNIFARIRVPLAKMEASRKYTGNPGSDAPIPLPVLHQVLGLGWALSPEFVISRRELADALLELLEEIRRIKEREK